MLRDNRKEKIGSLELQAILESLFAIVIEQILRLIDYIISTLTALEG